jgi:hypothetical protein
MAIVANPRPAEAVNASHKARRSPRQGVRASCSNRAFIAGSSWSREGVAMGAPGAKKVEC